MMRLSLCVLFMALGLTGVVAQGPANIWPLPQKYSYGDNTSWICLDTTFKFSYDESVPLLHNAVHRYLDLVFQHVCEPCPSSVPTIEITLASTNDSLQYGVDESYILSVLSSGPGALNAQTVYGAMRGLETWAQLVSFNFLTRQYEIVRTPWLVADFPRFGHRGILIDSSRHFEPVATVMKVLDSMSYAKLNVMHWHLLDYQSLPYESRANPQFWDAAYSPYERYTQEDIISVVQHAKSLGIRVIMEFESPGHADSWCTGYPDVCPSPTCLTPLDPSTENVFNLIDSLVEEAAGSAPGQGIFPDAFLHFGGDEVSPDCWTSTPRIQAWMTANNFTTTDAYGYFIMRVHEIAAAHGRQPINWEEVFLNFGPQLNKSTIIQVWLDHATLAQVVAGGFRGILSNNDVWYLGHLSTNWTQFYLNEPYTNITDPAQQALILGGEVCMWGETVDSSDIFNTIWPRAAAAAERLWSAQTVTDVVSAAPRLHNFRCRLEHRGIGAAPVDNENAREGPPGPGPCAAQ